MNIGMFRGQVHCLEKGITSQLKLINLRKAYEELKHQLSADEDDWCRRIIFKENTNISNYQKVADDFWNCILNRRSIREFGGAQITNKDVFTLMQAGTLAPSSCNRQPIEFFTTEDKSMIRAISKIKKQSFVEDANTLLIPLANISVYPDKTYGKQPFYYFMYLDMGMAIQNILLTAHYLDIAMCCVNLNSDYQKIADFLGLPRNLVPIILLPCGYKTIEQTRPGKKDVKFYAEKYER